jgi:hypothetical protein
VWQVASIKVPQVFQLTLDKEGPKGGAATKRKKCRINDRTNREGRKAIFIEAERE